MAIVWLLTVFAALFPIQRFLFTRRGLRRVEYERIFSQPHAFAGQTVVMQEKIVNDKWIPLPWLRVETIMPSILQFKSRNAEQTISEGQLLQNHASLFSLPPFMKVVRKHEVLCVKRGVFRATTLSFTLGDLTGTSCRSEQRASNCAITVFPRLVDVSKLPISVRRLMQSALSLHEAFREDHFHVAGVRAYRSGDSLKQVNWSATAKTGQLLVNKRESMADNDLTIVLAAELMDDATNRRVLPEAFEEALSYAASVAQHITAGGGKAGLVFNGKVEGMAEVPLRVEPQAGREHLLRLLELMARFEPTIRLGLEYVLGDLAASGMRGANLLLITAFLTPKQEMLVSRLRQAGNRVETMLIYREASA